MQSTTTADLIQKMPGSSDSWVARRSHRKQTTPEFGWKHTKTSLKRWYTFGAYLSSNTAFTPAQTKHLPLADYYLLGCNRSSRIRPSENMLAYWHQDSCTTKRPGPAMSWLHRAVHANILSGAKATLTGQKEHFGFVMRAATLHRKTAGRRTCITPTWAVH